MRSILRTVRVYSMCQNSLRNLAKNTRNRGIGRVLRFRYTQLAMGSEARLYEKRLLCTFESPVSNYKNFASTRWIKQGVGEKCLKLGKMQQADWAAAQHLLSLFSSPFFRNMGSGAVSFWYNLPNLSKWCCEYSADGRWKGGGLS